jgi:hypothetical protein
MMSDIAIFVLGAIVTAMTLAAVILVGRGEAEDPAIKGPGD